MSLEWNKSLESALIRHYGKPKGTTLSKKYLSALPSTYDNVSSIDVALHDISQMETLSEKNPLTLNLYYSEEPTGSSLHLRLFQWNKPTPLSDILPILENFDLRTNYDLEHKILIGQDIIRIVDFAVVYKKGVLDLAVVTPLFQQAFIHIQLGLAENDGFNKLILGATLSFREITILRAYAKYLRQVAFRFSQSYIEKALFDHVAITKNLVLLFKTLHDPSKQKNSKQHATKVENDILLALEKVTSLDEDRIIRRLFELIQATLRTNYFQTTDDGLPKDYLSIKLNSRIIPDLPLPIPLYEIFVYSSRFEAIHLRNTKVARGGLRWSDRREDFRTEILALMKAQTVKNSIIVPSGAKGGFVLKRETLDMDRSALSEEVIFCYRAFIAGLLDITDNIIDNQFVRPKQVVCYDDADPYLVVAADKGTASFSDIANSISSQYHFWLGDAFASGGSTGYDHKKIGITARGAWESVKRHFCEFNINAIEANITVVGIGDMSGDVFGNGMLYSKNIKLVAAFDHRHVFIDPDPNPEIAYYERVRLFNLPTSSWENYNATLISKGGGVFKRNLKSIPLTPQMKKLLDVTDDALAPNDLVRAVLKAPVDLLFNGGIGTYVKASTESQTDANDRSNDYCRINGDELQCKVVCEGGNLGFTQLGRIEYALQGGLINTDFIDNSAGVDCSDHEVNLKILLDSEVRKHKLSHKKRNELLASMTKEVADLVLNDNYYQALIMSYSAFRAAKNIGLHQDYINELANIGVLNRQMEFLPDNKKLLERKAAGIGLARPELAILLAYTKIYIKEEILKSDLPEDDFLKQSIESAFPESIRRKYSHAMHDHRLHRDIIATQVSNHLVNEMGMTFVYRLQMETGATIEEIVRAYTVASNIFGSDELIRVIESLNFKIKTATQYEMLYHVRNLINLATRWFLHGNAIQGDLQKLINHFKPRIFAIKDLIPDLMGGITKEYLTTLTDEFLQAGLPRELARSVATYRAIYTSLNIVDVATKYDFDLIQTAKVYFAAGERINLLWFRDQIATDSREGHWNTLARLSLRDELDISQRALTVSIMKNNKKEKSTTKLIEKWSNNNRRSLDRWERILSMLHASDNVEYTMFFIAIRELLGLISTSESS